MKAIDLAEQGRVPDVLVRVVIRRILKQRLNKERKRYQTTDALADLMQQMATSPLAINTTDANSQHYEVPTSFYDRVLGQHKKYSCCYFESHVSNLSTAEEAMLALSCERAGIKDGMDILELGCGWGSLTLWLGRHYPNARITAVSNSGTQKDYILEQAAQRDINNIDVVTCDMNDFNTDKKHDRVVSIEMFEHMRNYPLLFERIAAWLKPDGKLWFHIFVHRTMPYFFQDDGEADWMARHFFTGGLMPSWDLPTQIPSSMKLENRWAINGSHYAKTSKAWLNMMDANSSAILKVFEASADPTHKTILFNRWRLFFMACEELFAYNDGREWYVAHYLFSNKKL